METNTQENAPEVKRLTPLEWKEKWRQQAIEKYWKEDPWEQHVLEQQKIKAERKEFKERMHLELQKRIDKDYKEKYPTRYWIKQFIKKYFIL